jgi:hypothetical protein
VDEPSHTSPLRDGSSVQYPPSRAAPLGFGIAHAASGTAGNGVKPAAVIVPTVPSSLGSSPESGIVDATRSATGSLPTHTTVRADDGSWIVADVFALVASTSTSCAVRPRIATSRVGFTGAGGGATGRSDACAAGPDPDPVPCAGGAGSTCLQPATQPARTNSQDLIARC